jgi:hypothetical protein
MLVGKGSVLQVLVHAMKLFVDVPPPIDNKFRSFKFKLTKATTLIIDPSEYMI